MKKAFTMVELVFVIVVIGILAGIAIPKFAATRDDAIISRALAAVASMRSAVATERQKRILSGNFDPVLDANVTDLLEYDLSSDWGGTNGLTFSGGGKSCTLSMSGSKLDATSCDLPGI